MKERIRRMMVKMNIINDNESDEFPRIVGHEAASVVESFGGFFQR